ncbi:MAG TPA: FAD-dependent monooxygenase [Stellaceae bacterium]|jgi:2-polyprenyl-6-methoxyphenol hydroxylase-like FAD-dependent oxidoreductase|nr:FAD-dependent monooxygenase [Stellaceae bacterium]
MAVTSEQHVPVLIVGAGPIGLALAGDLGRRGIDCLVIEQSDGVVYHPRATAINARTMELLRRFGVAERVKRDGTPPDFPHTALYLTGFGGFEIARIERPSHGGSTPSPISPERPQRCNQIWFDPILLDHAKSFPNIAIRYRCRFEALREAGEHVIVTARDLASDSEVTIVAQYVADCSGSHSRIRRQLGIAMSGTEAGGGAATEYHLSAFMRLPELWKHHDKGKAALTFFIDEKGNWRNLVMIDGKELYRYGLTGKEFYDNPDAVDVEALFQDVAGPNIPHEILSVLRWSASDVVADRYRTGHVFLVGDAAHQNHPSGGFGLNTGMGDMDNIGWKLAATLQGWGGAHLLDSYETERRPIGLRNINQAWLGYADNRDRPSHPDIRKDTPAGAAARAKMKEQILASQPAMVLTDGIALGYRYESSPIICPDDSEPTADNPTRYLPTARPGARAPHAWLKPPQNNSGQSTIDLYGGGFVLLRLGDDAPDASAIEHAFRERQMPIATVAIGDPVIAKLYEKKLVLVRPDGHVAWRGDAVHQDPLSLADRVRGASE